MYLVVAFVAAVPLSIIAIKDFMGEQY